MNARPVHLHGLRVLLSVIAVFMGGAFPLIGTSATSTPTPACPVTLPNTAVSPGEPLRYGDGGLSVDLWPQGVVLMLPENDYSKPGGPFAMKFPWWRNVAGKLTITGRRLDGDAPPLTASIPDGYGDHGFQSTGIIFPTAGCWEVTGHAGDTSLTFVTLVVEIDEPAMPGVPATPAAAASHGAGCPVTIPNGEAPPRAVSYPGWHRGDGLWVGLSPTGTETHPAISNLRDGAVDSIWEWWRGSPGTLVVTGRRLDGPAPALGAVAPNVYGPAGYQASVLFFPTPGCWQVTGTLNQTTLSVVVQIFIVPS